jgi:hypothetical protein
VDWWAVIGCDVARIRCDLWCAPAAQPFYVAAWEIKQ